MSARLESMKLLEEKGRNFWTFLHDRVLESMWAEECECEEMDRKRTRDFGRAIAETLELMSQGRLTEEMVEKAAKGLAVFLNATDLMLKWKKASSIGMQMRDETESDQETLRLWNWLDRSGLCPLDKQVDAQDLLELLERQKAERYKVLVGEALQCKLTSFQFAHICRFVEFFTQVLMNFPPSQGK